MALSIRLSRGGAKKRPYYRIVVADSRAPRDGRFIEKLGTYSPLLPRDSAERVALDVERARHWLSVGAQPTDRVERFLDAAGLLSRTARNNPTKGAPGEKARERTAMREQKEAEAAEAAAAAAAAPAVAAVAAEAVADDVQLVAEDVAPEVVAAEEVAVEDVAVTEAVAEEAAAEPVAEPAVVEAVAEEAPVAEAPAEGDAAADPEARTEG